MLCFLWFIHDSFANVDNHVSSRPSIDTKAQVRQSKTPFAIRSSIPISSNQPKFCPNASWNPDAEPIADNTIIGQSPFSFLANKLNSISLFVVRRDNRQILLWRDRSVNPPTTIFANLSSPSSLFVSSDEEIFSDNGSPWNRVERWTSNVTQLPSPMSKCVACYDLVVDSNDDCGRNRWTGIHGGSAQRPLGNLCDEEIRFVYLWLRETPHSIVSRGRTSGTNSDEKRIGWKSNETVETGRDDRGSWWKS